MKKQVLFYLFVLSFSPFFLFSQVPGQTGNIEKEEWEEKPVIHPLDSKYSKESAVILFDKRRYEYVDEAKEEIGEYYTLHKLIHVNDDIGIEVFNKIYLGINENSSIVDIRARTILPNGKIIDLDKNNIKDLQEEDGNVYKIFAMEGLEKGSEIEYFYTYKKPTSYFGREVIKGRFPVKESAVQVMGPERLEFEMKPYNCSHVKTDTVINGKREIQCKLADIEGAEEEKYASDELNRDRIEFKLSYNSAIHKGERLFTWNELVKRVYSMYTGYSEKELKKITELVNRNGWDKINTETEKIIAVENYLKKNFAANEDLGSDEANKLEKVLQNKTAGIIGTMRLYSSIFQELGVNYQFVLTGDRDKFIIDREFENWNNCDYPIIYFPAENKFLAPTRPDFRYPWINPNWGGTNGLFCKKTSLGNFTTAIAEVKLVKLEDYSKSYSNIESKLELNIMFDSITIDATQSYAGYSAVTYRDIFNFANAEQKQSSIKELAKFVTNSEHILSSEIKNQEFENSNHPFILHTVTKSGELIEKAGNKILVKIGMAIGPQVEMYQEKQRQQPVNMEFGHVEERKLDLIIPDGYTVKNADDLKIEQTYNENGELTMGFVSEYKFTGNTLSIHIMEQYRKTNYPLSQFDAFRKIINASSDFNKIILVLEKK
ncbi:MAG TPA: DUF3857 domain-containing protein [Puia sp.]|nr:DUF3857 domain-containing protein [Puia sp.]